MRRLPWMYALLKHDVILFECPLCKAAVASGSIQDHTSYHKGRGEADKGES